MKAEIQTALEAISTFNQQTANQTVMNPEALLQLKQNTLVKAKLDAGLTVDQAKEVLAQQLNG